LPCFKYLREDFGGRMEILGYIGALIYLIAWIWLIVVAFQSGGVIWAIINIFLQPITGLIFCIVKKTGWLQLTGMILGLVLASVGFLPAILKTLEQFK
jgi:hypothetical protein